MQIYVLQLDMARDRETDRERSTDRGMEHNT